MLRVACGSGRLVGSCPRNGNSVRQRPACAALGPACRAERSPRTARRLRIAPGRQKRQAARHQNCRYPLDQYGAAQRCPMHSPEPVQTLRRMMRAAAERVRRRSSGPARIPPVRAAGARAEPQQEGQHVRRISSLPTPPPVPTFSRSVACRNEMISLVMPPALGARANSARQPAR